MFTERQHTVPRFYLSNFLPEGEGKFWVYDKKTGGEPRHQSPRDSAVITNFYTFQTPDGEKENLEKEFSLQEGKAKPIFDRWQEPRATPLPEEIEIVAPFLAFQQTRIPRAVRMVQDLGLTVLLEETKKIAKDKHKVMELWKKYAEEKGKDDAVSLEWFQAILENPLKDFEIKLNDKYALGMALQKTGNLVPSLLDRNWCLCVAPGNSFFLTSDTPVSAVEPDRNRAWIWGGSGLRNAEVLFPISSGICLLLSHRHTKKRWSHNERFVYNVNLTTVSLAERFIYSPRDTKQIRRLVTESSVPRGMTQADYERLKQVSASLKKTKGYPEPME